MVIPKIHYETIFETPKHVLERINVICKKPALLCKERLGCAGVNILNASGKDAQQSVFHLHYHIVLRYNDDSLNFRFG